MPAAGLLILLLLPLWSALGGTTEEGKAHLAENAKKPGVTVLASGLQYRVLKSGQDGGKSPKANSPCECHYKGTTLDGKEFDSSYKRGKPTTFAPNQVIRGWTEAMQLMREGDQWELTIPSELAYGDSGAGGMIKPGDVLVFTLELIKVKEPSSFNIMGIDLTDPKILIFGAILLYVVYQQFAGSGGASSNAKIVKLSEATSPENPRVFFDMEIGGEAVGRVEMELFAGVCPKTAENFRCLCTGEKGKGKSGKDLHFRGSSFHRVIPSFMCQGGDFTNGNGTGGESIYGSKFADEFDNGVIKHSEPMLLSMANAGPNTNGSQFFITVAVTSHLDGKHVVFGRVLEGKDVIKKIEGFGSSSGSTKKKVIVADCGQIAKESADTNKEE